MSDRGQPGARLRAGTSSPWLGPDAWARLERRIDEALRRARRSGQRILAGVTVPAPAAVDVSAAVLRARAAGDRCFCFEQPERDGFAVAALGEAAVVEARGGRRLTDAAEACRVLGESALCDDPASDPERPPGAGPVWVGGFSFADDGGTAPEWGSLAPVQLVMPEIAFAREQDQARLTASAVVDGDEAAESVLERIEGRLAALDPDAVMPLADPHPFESSRVAGTMPPTHYLGAVARAVERIRDGELEKIVLAREVRVHAPRPIDAAAVLGGLRDSFPACYCYLVGTPESAFVGASPELLVRREGARSQTVALAGTARRSADPSVDDHLGELLLRSTKEREEQAIVARRIDQALRPVSVWVAAANEPVLVKVHNVQHLATPIRAQLTESVGALELAARLHPTPAVGGEPVARALEAIPELEGLDRGWYAGAVGWSDLSEDGELCVALRCALIRDCVAHLYAGDGIVRDSVPEEELAETEIKLEALLPLLA